LNETTLHQLRVFEAVARRGSCNRAAEELFMSQPNVSLHIKQLSKAVGMPLFEKIGKHFCLTEVGRELLATSQEMFEVLDNFESKVVSFKGLTKGKLNLAATKTAKYVIPKTLTNFCELYPGIHISLEITNDKCIGERIGNNVDDLYIMSYIPENLEVNLLPFIEDSLVVVAPANHSLAGVKNIPLESLKNEKFIMREPGSGTRSVIQNLLYEQNMEVPVKLVLSSNEAIKQTIAGGFGISILSYHALMPEPLGKELTILDVENFPIKRTWYVVYPAKKQLTLIARTYLEHLMKTSELQRQFDSMNNELTHNLSTHNQLGHFNDYKNYNSISTNVVENLLVSR